MAGRIQVNQELHMVGGGFAYHLRTNGEKPPYWKRVEHRFFSYREHGDPDIMSVSGWSTTRGMTSVPAWVARDYPNVRYVHLVWGNSTFWVPENVLESVVEGKRFVGVHPGHWDGDYVKIFRNTDSISLEIDPWWNEANGENSENADSHTA